MVRQRGSHIRLEKQLPDKLIKITIPAHRPVKRSTLSRILKQAEADLDDFLPSRRIILTADPIRGPIFRIEPFMILKVVFEPSDEGGFTVYVPALPGCVSEGDTWDETIANIREAAESWLEVAAEIQRSSR